MKTQLTVGIALLGVMLASPCAHAVPNNKVPGLHQSHPKSGPGGGGDKAKAGHLHSYPHKKLNL